MNMRHSVRLWQRTLLAIAGVIVVAAVTTVALAGCSSRATSAAADTAATPSSSTSSAPAATSSTVAQSAEGISCSDIAAELATVVGDLKSMDARYQEAWVSGGDSADLQALINTTANAVSGTDQLNDDAVTFNTDATNYLSDNSPFLAPGWQSGYSQVTNDINAMATDCGLPTAPTNTPANS